MHIIGACMTTTNQTLFDILDDLECPTIKAAEASFDEVREWIIRGERTPFEHWFSRSRSQMINQRSTVDGRALLHIAIVHERYDIVKYLVNQKECNVAVKTMLGSATALHLAASKGERAIVFLLLTNGANARSRDRFGNTPLHFAATKNCARLLIEYGARVNTLNRLKQNCVTTAQERKSKTGEGHEDQLNEVVLYLDRISAQEYADLHKTLRKAKELRLRAHLEQHVKKK